MLHKLEDHQPAAVPSLQDALALARRGLHVFPITPGEKAPPLIKQWQKFATTDPDQIRSWWSQWPDANIGTLEAETMVTTEDQLRAVALYVRDDLGKNEISLQSAATWLERQDGVGIKEQAIRKNFNKMFKDDEGMRTSVDIPGIGGAWLNDNRPATLQFFIDETPKPKTKRQETEGANSFHGDLNVIREALAEPVQETVSTEPKRELTMSDFDVAEPVHELAPANPSKTDNHSGGLSDGL